MPTSCVNNTDCPLGCPSGYVLASIDGVDYLLLSIKHLKLRRWCI